MAENRRRKYVEVPLTIGDNIRYIKGVTKYTTCGDIVKMVLRKLEDGKEQADSHAYGIFESSRGIERPIPTKSRLLKVMRSWGMDNQFEFIFRKIAPKITMPKMSEAKRRKLTNRNRLTQEAGSNAGQCAASRYSHPNEFVKELYFNDSDSSDDEDVPSVSQGNLMDQRFVLGQTHMTSCEISRNVTGQSFHETFVVNQNSTVTSDVSSVKYATRKTLKHKPSTMVTNPKFPIEKSGTVADKGCAGNNKDAHRHVKRHERLAKDIVSKISKLNQREGKDALLQRYFSEYMTYRSPSSRYLDTRFRERGDGAEEDTRANVNADIGTNATNNITPCLRGRRVPTVLTYDDCDNDSGHEGTDDGNDFNTAFISEKYQRDAQPVNSATFNVSTADHCQYQKLVDYSISESEADSILSDPSEISRMSEHAHNVSSVSDIVRTAFSESGTGSEDDAMESFMRTRLEEDFSDEGLSSLGSDDEKEILV
ncbi:uncharacterized protein LOC128229817 [Mya arenaria]|uniref:uncharacterized protein LOC128229817 n=1 Tax=Mya arenaria TaxID=6604 RepID=UPI0022E28863|nr:uncharacterized protein LOC128229817 [Mya arenaria]